LAGNDIVDLKQALTESNWKRKGYLEKVFTQAEQFLIRKAEYPEIMVWLFWTMKESAYKIFNRETKIRTFAPAAMNCNNLILHQKMATGNVLYRDQTYFTRSSITEKYIHTIAVPDVELLGKVSINIGNYDPLDTSYKLGSPDSVSHHGHYLALIYLSHQVLFNQ
jgi:phosphopantetheinyl transferase (holo-ACP synthase)